MANKNENGLTANQQLFADYYFIYNCNAKKAYMVAYNVTNEKTAEVNASKLLRNAKVCAYIEKRQQELQEATTVTQEYVIGGLKEVAERCLKRKPVMVFNPISKELEQKTETLYDADGNVAGEAGVYTFDSIGANKALELLGKTLGLYTDKKEISGGCIVELVDDVHE